MTERCPICGHDLPEQCFYVVTYDLKLHRFEHCIVDRVSVPGHRLDQSIIALNGKQVFKADIVGMTTGQVYRKEFTKELPPWIKEPVKRAIIATTKELPLVYKNSKVEKARKRP